jgi:two-component system sensor histidine kinase KdpD
MSDASRQRVAENLHLAEQLGAQAVTLDGDNPALDTVRYARAHNVTKIVLGKPTHARWRDLVRASFLEEMVRSSGDIDVYVISGEEAEARPVQAERRPVTPQQPGPYLASVATVAVTTAVSFYGFGRERLADVVMTYLLGIILVAMRFGYGPSLVATVLSVAGYDYLFIQPYYSFAVSDFQHVVTFAVMFVVAVVISSLTRRIRLQAAAAQGREQRTASLYAMSRELAATRAVRNLATVATQHVNEVFEARVALLLATADGKLENVAGGEASFEPDEKERAVAEWVWTHDKPAGLGTDTLPAAQALYMPLHEARGRVGVLGVLPTDRRRFVDPEQRALLDVFASQIASALERARLAEEAQAVHLQMEAERLRSSLLSSVSHDLRTPLTVITGAASALLSEEGLGKEARRDLQETIHEEAQRLNRLVRNLLDMTRIAAGAIQVAKEWQPLEEVVGAALNRTEDMLGDWKVEVRLPKDLPLVPIDAVLIEQLLINILENAAKYTPKGTEIVIAAKQQKGAVEVEVADRGPGIPSDLADKIFEKFFRLPGERAGGGAGLGLAIGRGIVEAHGGKIWAENRPDGGAVFRFTIPIEGTPPELKAEEPAR